MEGPLSYLKQPMFRPRVNAVFNAMEVVISHGDISCSFQFPEDQAPAVSRLIDDLKTGSLPLSDIISRSPEIAEHVPRLLEEFDRLRLLTESLPQRIAGAVSGAQLYRNVFRLTDRLTARHATSDFYRALVEKRATKEQLIGYALEYYWIVQTAPGVIGPALASCKSPRERALLQDFLKSELGHDLFLANALHAVGVTQAELEAHQPLSATFSLCAALGVYGRQDILSFKACLFLLERAQPAFVDAFDIRCRELGLPEEFYNPLRAHANLNEEYGHDDISLALMALESAVDPETCRVVKRHVSIFMETLLIQEQQILAYYGRERDAIPRVFN